MLVWINRQFHSLADFLVSQALIMIVLALFMAYRYFEVLTLFNRVLPADVSSRATASALISAVFIFSSIIFMVHAYRIGKAVKVGIFITALIINLYFWQVWTGDIFFKVFISVTLSSFDIGFAYLFHILRLEHHAEVSLADLQLQVSGAEESLDKNRDLYRDLKAKNDQMLSEIRRHTCPHCRRIFPSPKSINAHVPRCEKNPNPKP
jgi:hypothetical protein